MGGYISSFMLPSPDWLYKPDYQSPTVKASTKPSEPHAIQNSEGLEAEANRRTGDMSIYLYYARSIGWVTTGIFIFFITAFVFCVSFPSKSDPE